MPGLPADFPPWSTVYNHFPAWESAGATQSVLDGLGDRVRLAEGRNAAPTASSIDSASVNAAETVGASSRGFDSGKKINGRTRHIAVDTLGLLICVLVTSAGVQDRVAARNLLARLRYDCPSIRHLWADSGYTDTLLTWTTSPFGPTIDIVAKLAGHTGFVVRTADGSSNESWLGSTSTTAACTTTNDYPNTTKPSSAGP